MNNQPDALNKKLGIPNAATFSIGQGSMTKLTLNTPHATAEVYLHGCTLTNYTPTHQQPIIFLSPTSHFKQEKAIRGGIPICFPWFAQNSDDPALPMHGIARTAQFTPTAITLENQCITATFEFRSTPETHKIWPHQFHLKYQITLSDSLNIQMHVTNTDKQSFDFEQALHTYYNIANINAIEISGLEKQNHIDKTDHFKIKQFPSTSLKIEKFTDAVCLDTDKTCKIHDTGNNRSIAIKKKNSASTIIWNPWNKKTLEIADLENTCWEHFICLETANVDKNRISLSPNQSHTLSLDISAAPLQ